MELTWGMKRKHEHDDEDSDKVVKKRKLNIDNELIYSIGNEIHFTDGVNKTTIEKIIKLMTEIIHNHEKKHKNDNKKLKITYIVDSPGGSVTAVLKFVDFIKLAKKKYPYVEFTSIATGMVASAGTTMCVVADKRLMTKHAYAMIHELSSGSYGKYTQLMTYSDFLKIMHNTLLDIYMAVAKISREEMEVLLSKESWFDAEGYMTLGLVDGITTD